MSCSHFIWHHSTYYCKTWATDKILCIIVSMSCTWKFQCFTARYCYLNLCFLVPHVHFVPQCQHAQLLCIQILYTDSSVRMLSWARWQFTMKFVTALSNGMLPLQSHEQKSEKHRGTSSQRWFQQNGKNMMLKSRILPIKWQDSNNKSSTHVYAVSPTCTLGASKATYRPCYCVPHTVKPSCEFFH